MNGELLYKVLRAAEWQAVQTQGVVRGSPDDTRDGFIHLSTREQLDGTLARHFAGESGLVMLEIAADFFLQYGDIDKNATGLSALLLRNKAQAIRRFMES